MPEALKLQIDRLEEVYLSEQDPTGRAFVPLADAHRRMGELDRALEVLREGLEVHPDFASGHVVAGWLHRDRGEEDEAIRSFERVLELDDENGIAIRSLAGLVGADRGLAYAERWAELEPQDPEAVATLEALRAAADGTEAAVDAEAPSEVDEAQPARAVVPVQSLAPDAAPAVVPIATLAPDQAPAVVPIATLAPDRAPADEPPAPEEAETGDRIYTKTLAELYAKQGATDKAVDVYRKLLENDPDNPSLLHRIAELRRGADAAPGPGAAPAASGEQDAGTVVPVASLAPEPEPAAAGIPAAEAGPVAETAEDATADAGASEDDRPVVPIESLAPEGGDNRVEDPFPWMNKL